jgi:hypothetical protein
VTRKKTSPHPEARFQYDNEKIISLKNHEAGRAY